MAKLPLTTKRLLIDQAQARMMVAIGVASFVVIFSLIAMKGLYGQMSYQNRVISGKEKAVKQLHQNVTASATLVDSFKTFDASPSMLGNTDSNAKIVLDALPSKYDFPALTASLEKILTSGGYKIESIAGVDDEANQTSDDSATTPAPVEMPFQISASATYQASQKLVSDFERSIRPFNIQSIELTGNESAIRIDIEAKTYFQPERNLSIPTKVVK